MYLQTSLLVSPKSEGFFYSYLFISYVIKNPLKTSFFKDHNDKAIVNVKVDGRGQQGCVSFLNFHL